MKATKIILIALTLLSVSIIGLRIVKNIQFNQNCGGYLKRATTANTTDLAKQELAIAIEYIEENNLTSGYTSIFYKTPSEDVGFWYNNIKSSYIELSNLSDDATMLERSNLLMKLRESLTEQGEKSAKLVVPQGISVYPNNTIWFICMLFSCVFLFCLAGSIQVIYK